MIGAKLLIEAIDLLESNAHHFLMERADGTLHHSFMSVEEATCDFLVRVGRLEQVGRATYRWAKVQQGSSQGLTTSTGCEHCGGTGLIDSGGVHPWGEGINLPCKCVLNGKS